MTTPVIVMINTQLSKIKTIWIERGKTTSEEIPLILNEDPRKPQISSKSKTHPTIWTLWDIHFSKETYILKMQGGSGKWYEYKMDSPLSEGEYDSPITIKCLQYTTKGGQIKTPDKWHSPQAFQYDWVMDKDTYIVLLNYLMINF